MILAIAMQTATLPPARTRKEETLTYTIRRGDTLDRLSRSFLVPERSWKALLRLSGTRNPRRLPIGRRMEIPRRWLRYTVEPAQLASYRGSVAFSASSTSLTPTIGMRVGEGVRIATGANSFVTLMLTDRSKIVIPSQSRVTVRHLRRILLTGSIEYRIDVEKGRLETKVTPVRDPSGRYRIGTPISMTAVRGTEFRVTFDEARSVAAAEVLAGTVAVEPVAMSREVLVERGQGASTDAAGETRIEPLLPAPDLIDPGRVQTREAVEFRVAPVEGAVRYRVVLASDAGFVDNYAEQIVQADAFAIPDVPNGNQFVRVSAIAATGLEGLPQNYSFSRRLASIRAEVRADEDGYRFRWFGAGEGARRYRFQLMPGSADSRPVVDEVGLSSAELTLRNLRPGVYHWRVGLLQIDASGEVESWTEPEKLTITAPARHRGR